MRVYVEGVGLCGPGFDGWPASFPILAGRHDYIPAPTRVPPGLLLPPNERRRTVQTVRLALAVGAEAFAAAGRDAAETATVFTSSGGDGETIHAILSTLASPDRELSPTRFHHSVHNTPAGYWGIATGSRAPSSSLCCHDDSFAAGLLEATVQATIEQCAVGLIAYDVHYPEPLNAVRPIGAPFAVALVLTPAPMANPLARVDMILRPKRDAAPAMASPALEALRRSTPAARSLPLLQALAGNAESVIALDYLSELQLALTVAPMPATITLQSERPAPVAQ